jgi:hypothetical protein
MPLRVLADPGGLARDVPEQGAYALHLLARLLGELGWEAAAPRLQAIVAAVVPESDADVRRLRGGAWLGLAAGERVELRLYLDLRLGGAAERWARAGAALDAFASDGRAAVARLAGRVGAHGIPVGVGAVVAGGAVRGVRLYHGLDAPDADSIAALGVDRSAVTALCAALGPFEAQDVIAGFDFGADGGGRLRAAPGRTKLDVALLGRRATDAIAGIESVLSGRRLPASELWAFLTDFDACFGGGTLQYASLGLGAGPPHVTAYVQPDGHAVA